MKSTHRPRPTQAANKAAQRATVAGLCPCGTLAFYDHLMNDCSQMAASMFERIGKVRLADARLAGRDIEAIVGEVWQRHLDQIRYGQCS